MSRIEQTEDGKYALVVNGTLVLYTSSKTIALRYLEQALTHTSREPYTIPLAEPLRTTSSK